MKGMTNALPVLIDASTLATKSDISDMETKTHANATFATKTELATKADSTTVTQIQTAVGDCFNDVALGSDGKSLDFTAVDGQVNNIILPSFSPYRYSVVEEINALNTTELNNYYNNFDEGYYVLVGNVHITITNTDWQTDGYYADLNGLYLTKSSNNINIISNGVGTIKKDSNTYSPYACIPAIMWKAYAPQNYYILNEFRIQSNKLPLIQYIAEYGGSLTSLSPSKTLTLKICGIWFKITDNE